MTDQPDDLFSAVDSLLAAVDDGTVLPAPAERTRLREAAGLTEAAVAQALGVRVPSIQAWEAGRAEPKGDRREAYRRLLEGLSHRYPAPPPTSPPAATPGPQVSPAAPLQRMSATHGTPADATEPSTAPPAAPAAGSRQPFTPSAPTATAHAAPPPGTALSEPSARAAEPHRTVTAPATASASLTSPAAAPGPQTSSAAPLQRTSTADGTPADATEPSVAPTAATSIHPAAGLDTSPAAPESAAPPQTVPAPPAADRSAPPGRPEPGHHTPTSATTAGTDPAPRPARRPAGKKAASGKSRTPSAPEPADPRFAHGPLAVIDVDDDGRVSAYCVGGLVLDVPARSLPALVEWTLAEARLGQPRLHRSGKDADPLVVLTESACVRYGLPPKLSDEERLAGRIPDTNKAVRQLLKADWLLTRRGFGPWAWVYRPAEGSRRHSVHFCLPSWNALDSRYWGDAGGLPAAELARVLGAYAARVLTPCGSTAVTGLELMTALHPPTRAVRDEHGTWVSAPNPGALTEAVDCAPCEAPDGHPLLAHLPRFHERTPAEMLREEAYDWARPLTDEECMRPYLVGIDVNMAFAAAANRTVVGLGAPAHVHNPQFDPALPGSWLVDLSHVRLDPRLPSPFTPDGETPEGPAWYATPTVAYALELGYEVAPLEAYVRPEHGPYLDAWYTRLRDAYIATMADLGVTTGMTPEEYLTAMAGHKDRDPHLALVLSAIKATVKGGIGKLRERGRSGWRPGERWPAMDRPTWRPDIRAAVIAKARINMHRKMLATARATGQYPVAVLSDCAVYASPGPTPLGFLPYRDGKPLPGGFRIGVSPGMVKHEGTQSVLWAEGLREEHGDHLNLARYIKSGLITAPDAEE
ncbi:telomere-associated protein Tap [Streptomyces camelliae]|uniref:Helix-turn-helix domain-containing protein n=1 Tax=Streptomyces camelliae TaxID=3004093 RepID=A0ABY7PIM4_9ACTN|nr:helix-turn-helix domain-containing protein [Streptomyces sp. HUAS 2-6]WBO68283.1 helix-turn-helix domain-containing protein [Streptomyces sp. HUAS 2-6]